MEKKYSVYEDNAGGLALIVYSENGAPEYIHTGYEYSHGALRQDLQALAGGDDPAKDWDGNELHELPAEAAEEIEAGQLVADERGVYVANAGINAQVELSDSEAEAIAQELRASDTWIPELCERLCRLAGLETEWQAAETCEEITEQAADVLGVEIY